MTGPLPPPGPLTHGTELNAVYAIARIVAEAFDTEAGLEAVFRLARSIFIFDVAALYLENQETGALEPAYARALGRGRSQEADVAWGEPAAFEAFRTGETVLRHEDLGPSVQGRERRRDYLGLSLMVGGRCVGGLVFGRFGGPPYPPEQIRLGEFVAYHVGQLLENRRMASRIASLEAQRELARMQDEFISTVSHELRTPLGFIKGYVTTLLREDQHWDTSSRNEFLHIIDDEADRLRELIDNLLDSSRLESGRLGMTCEPTRLVSVIKDAAMRIQSMQPGLEIALELPDELPIVQVDATRISQVLDNLLSNAVKYAPGAPVRIRAVTEPDQIRIDVEDRGPGIAAEHLPRLFERFYRVPARGGGVRGTGLGLHICRKIIEAHGGQVSVQSRMGEGTCFTFTIPFTFAPEPEGTPEGSGYGRQEDDPGR
jgi:signal transduction histidine kinase